MGQHDPGSLPRNADQRPWHGRGQGFEFLKDSGIKLSAVASDILGVSGRDLLDTCGRSKWSCV
jgi:hypothetical protein